jgi:hypothetical protein
VSDGNSLNESDTNNSLEEKGELSAEGKLEEQIE